jgi:PKD repeat protein
MNRLKYALLFCALLLLTACFRQNPVSVTLPEDIPVITDSQLDSATKDEGQSTTLEGTVDDSEAVSTDDLDPDDQPEAASDITTQAVLPGANGFVVYAWNLSTSSTPWRIYRHDASTDASTLIYSGLREINSVAVSGDGTKILASVRETNSISSDFEIYQITLSPLTVTQLTDNTGADTDVSMSVNADLYVWEGDSTTAGLRNVFVRDNRASPVTTTALAPTINSIQPSISSDGKFIALMRRSATNAYQAYSYERSTNIYKLRLQSSSVIEFPSLSDTATKIAWLQKVTTRYYLYIRDIGTATTTLLVNTTFPLTHPHLTADANYLTYSLQTGGRYVIYNRNLTTNQQVLPVSTTANLIAPYWQQTPPAPPPPPPSATDIQINGGAAPMVFGAGSFTFDASIFGGSNYQWSFGDGSSATGEFVEKEYTNPGKYTVSLSFTDAYGRPATLTTEVAKYDEIHNLPSTRAATGDNKVVFDVEFPLDGFIYEWDTGDGQKTQQPRVEKDYTSATAPGSESALGFYDVVLNVYDNRQTTPPGIATAATAPVLASTQYTRVNVYHPKPAARFTATSSQLIAGNIAAGNAPVTISFDALASTSEGTPTYTWDFGDGNTGTGLQVSHTYTTAGRYLVTLTVEDQYKQTDTANTFVFVLDEGVRISTLIRYSQTTAALMAGLDMVDTGPVTGKLLQSLAKENNSNTAQTTLEPQQTTATFVSYYPYVVDKNISWLSAQFFLKGNSAFVYTALRVFINAVQKPVDGSGGPISGGCYNETQGTTTTTLCRALTFTNAITPKPLNTGINTIQVINSAQLFELQFQAFAGLRVPRVVISILPDEQLPGNLPSPFLTENTVQINGKTELMLQVNIRESEATSGFAEFEIPVYAVNDAGSQIGNMNGLFKARFNSLPDSEVADGVMIGGKAYIKVKVPLATYTNGTTQLDLSQIRVYSAPTCDTASFYQLPTNYPTGLTVPTTFTESLFGCNTVTATYDAPVGTPVEAYPYTIPADYLSRTNRIFLGKSADEQTKYDNNFKDVPGNVATFVIGFIPILGDSVDLLTQVYNSAVGKAVDPVMATLATGGLILDITTGGIGDLTSIFKGAYRLSLQAAEQGLGGVLAAVIKEQAQNLLTGAITARQFIQGLGDRFKTFVDFAKPGAGCGFLGYNCWGLYDNVAKTLKDAGGLDNVGTLSKLDNVSLKDPRLEGLGLSDAERLEDLVASGVACAVRTVNLRGEIEPQAVNPCPTTLSLDLQGRVSNVKATLDQTFIRGGSDTTAAARVWTRGRQKADDFVKGAGTSQDQAGHILAKVLGGLGGKTSDNIVPVLRRVNEGQMKQLELKLRNEVVAGRQVTINVTLEYLDPTYPQRPTRLLYEYTIDGVKAVENILNPLQ